MTKKHKDTTQQFTELEEKYKEILPKNWDDMSYESKLDWFGHRMLLDQREIIRIEQGNEAARDTGFLSDYQLERRRRREVQSKIGSWDDLPPRQGIFRRVYVDPNRFIINREDGDNNGQKNT
jgi:hypothetical protein